MFVQFLIILSQGSRQGCKAFQATCLSTTLSWALGCGISAFALKGHSGVHEFGASTEDVSQIGNPVSLSDGRQDLALLLRVA